MSTMARRLCMLNAPRAFLHVILFYISDTSTKSTILRDMSRWYECSGSDIFRYNNMWLDLNSLMYTFSEFRNLFYYRLRKQRSPLFRKLMHIFIYPLALLYHPLDSLYICCDHIKDGLFIQHGYSTGIGAQHIGSNCWINHNVTIGFLNNFASPRIGDNVTINTGAIILGDVTIGNNSIIGAGTVVVKNVPDNCTVVGSRAYIVRKNGVKVREEL